MTGTFDTFRRICLIALENPKYREIALWVADICIPEADSHKEDWTFEAWKTKNTTYTIYPQEEQELRLKYGYLEACHGVLDHALWHNKVFSLTTYKLTEIVEKIVTQEQDVYDVNKVQRQFPQIVTFLTKFGYKKLDKKGWMWTTQTNP